PDSDTLIAQLTFEVSRGSLHVLPLKLPAGWQVESVDLDRPELLLNWAPVKEKDRTVLYVELQKPLTPKRDGQLTVQLRKAPEARIPRVLPPGGVLVPFPALEPLDRCLQEGALGIQVDPHYQAVPLDTSVPATTPLKEPRGNPPWEEHPLSFYFPF